MDKRRMKESFFVTLITGIIMHIFALTNIMHNYDSLVMSPEGIGASNTSGRWFLRILSRLFFGGLFDTGSINVPFFNILVTIVLLAISAMLIVETLDVKNRCLIWLTGIIFVCFPTVVSNIAFHFTCHFYSFAILFAVAAVFLNEKFPKFGWIGSSILIMLSLGTYQAFVPLAIMLFLLNFIRKIINDKITIKHSVLDGFRSIGILLAGTISYFLVTKIHMHIKDYGLTTYKGIENMGRISLQDVFPTIYKIYLNICLSYRNNYYGINETDTLKAVIFIFGVISFLMLFFVIIKNKNVIRGILAFLAFCLLPLSFDFISFMCPDGIYTLMVYSSIGIFYTPIILFGEVDGTNFCKKKIEKIYNIIKKGIKYCIVFLLLIVSINYIWLGNGNYVIMYYTQEQTINFFNQLYTRIRAEDGYSADKKLAFIGEPNDATARNLWDFEDNPFHYGGIKNSFYGVYSQYLIGFHFLNIPPQSQVSAEELEKLRSRDEIMNMPVYPNDGSIKSYDDIIVVRFAE